MEDKRLEERVKVLEQRLATAREPGYWLTNVAIVCFILAAGFLIKLSIDSGWLTPERQMGLAALLGLGLAGAGLALSSSGNPHVNLLPGAGINVLFLTAFAAHRLYALISSEIAVAVTSVFSGICLWLYTELEYDIYAVTAALGAYVIPIVFGFSFETSFTISYYVLCSLTFASISVWMRSRMLTMISSYLAILSSAYVGYHTQEDMLIAIVLGVHFLIFSLGTFFYTARSGRPLTEREGWSFLPVLLVFYSMEFYFIDRIHPGLAPVVAIASAFVLLGLYLFAKRWFPGRSLGSESVIMAFFSLAMVHAVYLELTPEPVRPWFFVLALFALAWREAIPFLPTASENRQTLRIPFIALIGVIGIEFITMSFQLIAEANAHIAGTETSSTFSFNRTAIAIGALAGLWAIVLRHKGRIRYLPLGAAHVLVALIVYRFGHSFGAIPVSGTWLAYGILVALYGRQRDDKTMTKSALFVITLAIGKIILFDLRN